MIASVYIGFAVADGRWTVLALESGVASGFIIIAAAAITGTPWLLVVGLAGHGLKDLWQHRTQFVANTRWWPPFCLVVDFVVAAIITIEIVAGGALSQLGSSGEGCRRPAKTRVQNGYVSSGTSGHARPLEGRETI